MKSSEENQAVIADLLREHHGHLNWLPFAAEAYLPERADWATEQADRFYHEGQRDLPILEVYERVIYAVETGNDVFLDEEEYRWFLQLDEFCTRIQELTEEGIEPFQSEGGK